jgi:hypothetical protein
MIFCFVLFTLDLSVDLRLSHVNKSLHKDIVFAIDLLSNGGHLIDHLESFMQLLPSLENLRLRGEDTDVFLVKAHPVEHLSRKHLSPLDVLSCLIVVALLAVLLSKHSHHIRRVVAFDAVTDQEGGGELLEFGLRKEHIEVLYLD